MVKALSHFLRVLALLALAGYLIVLVHIPIFEFMHDPTTVLGAWLALAASVLVVGGWLVYSFSLARLGVWLSLVALLHGAIWLVGGVQIAFLKDSCLDRSGAWHQNACVFE